MSAWTATRAHVVRPATGLDRDGEPDAEHALADAHVRRIGHAGATPCQSAHHCTHYCGPGKGGRWLIVGAIAAGQRQDYDIATHP
jgi:hypothetical protein